MTTPKTTGQPITARAHELATQWAPGIIILATIVIVVSTLYPFKFTIAPDSLWQTIRGSFRRSGGWLDFVANIVLFAPLGFGLASALAKRRFNFRTKLLAIVLICGVFSLGIEIGQAFLAGRKSTVSDVISNALGGGVGFLCFQLIGAAVLVRIDSCLKIVRTWAAKLSLQHLIVALVTYAIIAGLIVVYWEASSLRVWYSNLPLAIGREYTVYQPRLQREVTGKWAGSLADVLISDRALNKSQVERFFADPQAFAHDNSSLLANYPLRGEDGIKDAIGKAPDLTWKGSAPSHISSTGVSLKADQWLETVAPATSIIEGIRRTGEFTLSATMAAADSSASNPAVQPILLLSPSPFSGNLSLSQIRSGLDFNFTNARTNRNPRQNRYLIPDLFLDNSPHQIVVTYSAFVVRIYVDGVERLYVADFTPNRYQIMLYLLILVPLAVLIVLIAHRLRYVRPAYLVWLAGGTLLPSLILETYLATAGDRTMRLSNLLLGMLIVGGTILAAKGNLFKRKTQNLAANF